MPNKKYYAKTRWEVQDVIQFAEQNDHTITEQQAKLLLKQHEEAIIESMIAAGWEVIVSAVENREEE